MTTPVASVESLNTGPGRLADAAAAQGRELPLLTSNRTRHTHELSKGPGDVVEVIAVDPADVEEALRPQEKTGVRMT